MCLQTFYNDQGGVYDSFMFDTVERIELGADMHKEMREYDTNIITSSYEIHNAYQL